MALGPRFSILNLMTGIALLAVASWAVSYFSQQRGMTQAAEAIFWLILSTVAVSAMLLVRYVGSREIRWVLMGLAVALGSLAIAFYLGFYLRGYPVADVLGGPICMMMGIALVLVGGGVADGLLARRAGLAVGDRREPPESP